MRKGLKVKDDETYIQYIHYNIVLIDNLNNTSLIRMNVEGENVA